MNVVISEERLYRLVTKYIDIILGVLEGEKNQLNTRVAYFDYKERLVFVVDLKSENDSNEHKWSISLQFLQRVSSIFRATDEDEIDKIVTKYFSEISGVKLRKKFTYLGGYDF
jgi:hypothetical protein